jgi:hypothetical protein
MAEDENFIRANISTLLSAPEVRVKTGEIGGEWTLNEIHFIHGMPRNIEFSAIFENGSASLKISAKIHRDSARFLNIKVEDF